MDQSKLTSDTSKARVLLVDDEAHVCSALTRSLTLLGFQTDQASSGQEGLDKLKREDYDVMVLDIRMPGMDGVETMRRALAIYPDLIIIILTGHASLNSAIAAVKAGAADYLHKPVSIYDLAAAISRALERRSPEVKRGFSYLTYTSGGCNMLACGSITLNKDALWVLVDGVSDEAPVKITASEAEVLACLMTHPNHVLSCRELARAALGYDVCIHEARKIVRPHISRLRSKLGEEGRCSDVIETIVGKGYLFRPEPLED
ncbi:MAG TPA: response regulator transcription factor [Chloroflexi bacterium]|nr:response regulator transcription factor [Chloroflexota bacterium]